jgi:hypothetical protein
MVGCRLLTAEFGGKYSKQRPFMAVPSYWPQKKQMKTILQPFLY